VSTRSDASFPGRNGLQALTIPDNTAMVPRQMRSSDTEISGATQTDGQSVGVRAIMVRMARPPALRKPDLPAANCWLTDWPCTPVQQLRPRYRPGMEVGVEIRAHAPWRSERGVNGAASRPRSNRERDRFRNAGEAVANKFAATRGQIQPHVWRTGAVHFRDDRAETTSRGARSRISW